MTDLSERPFFVVGNPRSGTTLLRFILSSHPRLHIPGETGFLPFLGFEADAQLSAIRVRRVLAQIGTLNREWAGLVHDPEVFYSMLAQPTLACVLDQLYRKVIEGHGAVRWGDKTPDYVRYLPLLSRIFATAQFVHVIRDGRDATLSARKKWGRGRWYMDDYYLLRNWARNVERGRAAGQALPPGRYLEIRYEDLVREPESTLRVLCDFLGEPFHAAMLDHSALAREQIGPQGHIEVREPISTASVGRWRTGMSPFWKRVADAVSDPTLIACGYERSGQGPLSRIEWLQVLPFAAKYALVQGARRALRGLGLLTLNRGKRNR
jgi:hypothetical protein